MLKSVLINRENGGILCNSIKNVILHMYENNWGTPSLGYSATGVLIMKCEESTHGDDSLKFHSKLL